MARIVAFMVLMTTSVVVVALAVATLVALAVATLVVVSVAVAVAVAMAVAVFVSLVTAVSFVSETPAAAMAATAVMFAAAVPLLMVATLVASAVATSVSVAVALVVFVAVNVRVRVVGDGSAGTAGNVFVGDRRDVCSGSAFVDARFGSVLDDHDRDIRVHVAGCVSGCDGITGDVCAGRSCLPKDSVPAGLPEDSGQDLDQNVRSRVNGCVLAIPASSFPTSVSMSMFESSCHVFKSNGGCSITTHQIKEVAMESSKKYKQYKLSRKNKVMRWLKHHRQQRNNKILSLPLVSPTSV